MPCTYVAVRWGSLISRLLFMHFLQRENMEHFNKETMCKTARGASEGRKGTLNLKRDWKIVRPHPNRVRERGMMIKSTLKRASGGGKWATKDGSELKSDAGLLCDMNIIQCRSLRAWWKHRRAPSHCCGTYIEHICHHSIGLLMHHPGKHPLIPSCNPFFLNYNQWQTYAVDLRRRRKLRVNNKSTNVWISLFVF